MTFNKLSAAWWRFAFLLALLLGALLISTEAQHRGDAVEYSLVTVALATHGTPDVRPSDITLARSLAPALQGVYDLVEPGLRQNGKDLYPAFAIGKDGKAYSIHFFGYSLLAAPPFKLLHALGLPPFKAYQIINLGMVFVLGLSLFRLFGSAPRALLGVLLFMLCGGWHYGGWGSPECLSAAALLAALILYCDDAPIAGGVLAGLAALQNPTIVFFFAYAPLLRAGLHYRADAGWRVSLRAMLQRRYLLGLAIGVLLALLPVLWNLYQFGVPSIIAQRASDPALISLIRLHSFYFDLNQGMIMGIPGVMAMLLLWGWRKLATGQIVHQALLLLSCVLFTMALAIPAMAIHNWNSDAAGVMRYAFWASMPFLFALFWRLRTLPRWPVALLFGVVLVQAVCTAEAKRYNYVELSPLCKWIMQRAPGLVNPEPEIFVERSGHLETYLQQELIYTFNFGGRAIKTLYNPANTKVDEQLCGTGNRLASDNHYHDTDRQWRYINGPVRCQNSAVSHH